MKLPSLPQLHKKESRQLFLSLLLYPDAVEAAVWEIQGKGKVSIIGAVTQQTLKNGWEERLEAADKCITTLEGIAKSTEMTKVILGLPAPYLTHDGDIVKDVRPHIKKLTHALGLEPIGFVSIYQAIIHKYKRDEGVPPSLILLGFTAGSITVSLYRVGVFTGQVTIPTEGSVAAHLEDALLQFPQTSVLPSRILLYGTKLTELEDAKREILKHHWTSRANFIHFPKVEILQGDGAAIAVSYAGAAELTHTLGEDEIEEQNEAEETEEETEEIEETEETQEEPEIEEPEIEAEPEPLEEDEVIGGEEIVEGDDDIVETEEITASTVEISRENERLEFDQPEHANVIPVDPEALGFSDSGSLDQEEEIQTEHRQPHRKRNKFSAATFITALKEKLGSLRKSKRSGSSDDAPVAKKPARLLFLIIPIVLVIVGLYFLFDTLLPKATITLVTIPQTVTLSQNLVVDPNTSEIVEGRIPGKKKEQSISGEKTVPATGKKTVGEAGKGTVTIVNKSTVSRTFKKGTTITTGGIDFTLDQDVSIASASETFQGITYSKANVVASAKQIGVKGNIAAGKDFTISGIATSIATGRNDEAFTGGTSTDLTVVSRADQDAIVKELTTELIAKANEAFQAESGETLITDTVKTTVTEKTFSAEIGEEATEVNGKVTITISGIGFSTSDITKFLREKVKEQTPEGYALSSDLPRVETESPEVAKDGSIELSATINATALPAIDLATITTSVSGKSVADAKQTMLSLVGVSDVTFAIQSVLHKDSLPKRPQNISIVVNTGK